MAQVGLKMGCVKRSLKRIRAARVVQTMGQKLGLVARLVQTSAGVKVANTLFDGPAQRSGLAPKDVIIAVDGLKPLEN